MHIRVSAGSYGIDNPANVKYGPALSVSVINYRRVVQTRYIRYCEINGRLIVRRHEEDEVFDVVNDRRAPERLAS